VRHAPLWRNRDYLLLWGAQVVSTLGTYIAQIAFPLLVLTLTGSPAQAGLVAAARSAPALLFTLPAGALVDRWDRRLTMLVCALGAALALVSIPVAWALGALTVPQLALVSFIEGTFATVFGLAEVSALPRVVPRGQLPAAVAQQQIPYFLGAIAGPPLGGALYATMPLLPFAVDATSKAVAAAAIGALRGNFAGSGIVGRRPLRAEIGEGVRWLWGQRLIRFMALLGGSLSFSGTTTLILIVRLGELGVSAAGTGAVFAAAGLGGLLGVAIAPALQRRLSFGQAIIGTAWYCALTFALYALVGTPALIAAVALLAGLWDPIYTTVQMSYRLVLIPDALQGRVNSAFRLVADGMYPLGLALAGFLLEWIGAIPTTIAIATWLAAFAALATANRNVREAPPAMAVLRFAS
jgi:predicted MFS family arabinose efflux permease